MHRNPLEMHAAVIISISVFTSLLHDLCQRATWPR